MTGRVWVAAFAVSLFLWVLIIKAALWGWRMLG